MSRGGTIILAEDDPVQQILVRTTLENHLPYQVLAADHGKAVMRALADPHNSDIKLIILDLEMPQMGGIETLQLLKEQYPTIPVIMLTASEAIDDAVNAMKAGALDFISKPPHPEHLKMSVLNAIKMQSLKNEVSRLKRTQDGTSCFSDLIGYDRGLASIIGIARKAASSDIPVLISGETGVGKEMFARAIHGESARGGGCFVAVNCGAIPKDLVESTLFGHEKGAFTGAINKSIGKFREAEGGTIFLDEVGELPLDAQVKLLRVLQQREVEPVGAGRAVPINVRIISATNRNLKDEVAADRFREDLFFRLDVLPIRIPALRERKQDISALAYFFIEKFATSDNLPVKTLTMDALEMIENYPWPGNVRALQNCLRRALVLSEGTQITAHDLKELAETEFTVSAQTETPLCSISLIGPDGHFKSAEKIEAEAMREAMHYHEGNITQAAHALGMAKSTFYKKLKLYNLA
ncbi:MAG: sigma-54-dependent transcriptional regulator [Rickettsiales bacterium]